jgi:hypothetical protein
MQPGQADKTRAQSTIILCPQIVARLKKWTDIRENSRAELSELALISNLQDYGCHSCVFSWVNPSNAFVGGALGPTLLPLWERREARMDLRELWHL